MFADQSLLVAIPQVETVQQHIQDRLRELSRSPGQQLQQVPAAQDEMRQAGLVKSLQKTPMFTIFGKITTQRGIVSPHSVMVGAVESVAEQGGLGR